MRTASSRSASVRHAPCTVLRRGVTFLSSTIAERSDCASIAAWRAVVRPSFETAGAQLDPAALNQALIASTFPLLAQRERKVSPLTASRWLHMAGCAAASAAMAWGRFEASAARAAGVAAPSWAARSREGT